MQKGFGKDVQSVSPRVSRLKKLINGLEETDAPDSIMLNIMEVFPESDSLPEVGNYYTFIYMPKTMMLQYDEHPLVAVTSVKNWGFEGINFHWGKVRRYSWDEVVGGLHAINQNEINYLRSLPFAKIRNK